MAKKADSFIPVNKNAVTRYRLTEFEFSPETYLKIKSATVARKLAFALNSRSETSFAGPAEISAIGLINAVYLTVVRVYTETVQPDLAARLEKSLNAVLTKNERENLKKEFFTEFPEKREKFDLFEGFFVKSLIIDLNNENPALLRYKPVFDNTKLLQNSLYRKKIKSDAAVFKTSGKLKGLSFDDFLREPFKRFPNSIFDQLAFIAENWADLIPDFLFDLQLALNMLKEDYKLPWSGGEEGSSEIPDYGLGLDEFEAYSEDRDWMPKVIMIAKSTLVWLSQLSQKYEKEIRRLDQIPDAELDILRDRGITALWLIGLWERSAASKRIKQICGNPDAEASAYSLYDYEIAASLGGWPALTRLKERCSKRGIRLSADMVPNHTAIDSRWISIHPDWFLQLPENPYPQYTFNGPDLSGDPNITVQIEDKYYSKEDCAVVFRRYDKNKNENRYIYHGNDGTGLPWNDTAQINFLNPEAKEAVIQVILHVARNFPIIRFDAAMTLAKRHIQRLWFPAPGQGGDIPTRAEHGMLTVDFNKAMPQEFWREVVDRVAAEVPDTLLLAEAFWMMEGYFVRTLGMHRVYNSAFMNMLKKEENAKYRYLIRETLEFDPDILKRYVNFMNNPDEKTAAEQFGKGDKYFGVCLLLATMPGLPMIGHGQIEGFYEKYGMEFSRPQWDEKPDQWLIERHEREIFPIFRKRYLFSEVVNFRLYNFNDTEGRLNENVFAYSNKCGNENALVVYNNKYESTAGTIKHTVLYKDKADGQMKHTVLADFIGIEETERRYVIFTDFIKSLSYIRSARDLVDNGLFCLLAGYEYQLFTDFHIVEDFDGRYENLRAKLNGSGCEDVAFEAEKLEFEAVSAFFKPIFDKNKTNFKKLTDIVLGKKTGKLPQWKFDEKIRKETEKAAEKLKEKERFQTLFNRKERIFSRIEKNCEKLDKIAQTLSDASPSQTEWLASLIGYHEEWTFAAALSLLAGIPETEEFLNGQILFETVFEALNGRSSVKADRSRTFALLSVFARLLCRKDKTLASALKDKKILSFAEVNLYQEKYWFRGEKMLDLIAVFAFYRILSGAAPEKAAKEFFRHLSAFEAAEYRMDLLVQQLTE